MNLSRGPIECVLPIRLSLVVELSDLYATSAKHNAHANLQDKETFTYRDNFSPVWNNVELERSWDVS